MNQVLMRSETDCGIASVANATCLPYERVEDAFDELNGDFRDDLNDSPLHHEAVLRKLGFHARIVTDDDILAGLCPIGRTVILVHDPQSPTLKQHWCNHGGPNGTDGVTLWWNVPGQEIRYCTRDGLKTLYRRGFPNCAYVVETGPKPIKWWTRLWVWLTSWF